jgi:hypothetical protein
MFEDQKKRYRKFREWQKMPHHVKPMTEEEHICPTCGRHYVGNYCPQCGQSSKIGRYSFKNAFLLFIDVWGLGNRGMFRTIRDLLLRPGYMIRDYLRGMQMAYFPPFKMFFLITALSLVIDSGLNIRGMNRQEHREEETEELFGVESSSKDKGNSEELDAKTKQSEVKDNKEQASEEENDKAHREYERMKDGVNAWLDNESNSSYVVLMMLLLYSFPLWLLIRRCPAIPDFRFSECFVAMVYIINMLDIYTLIPQFMCVSYKTEMIFSLTVTLLMIVPVKQLSGYSYWQAVWRMFVALILAFIMALVLYVFFFLMLNIYADIKYG